MNNRRKELKNKYKMELRPMGVYQILNLANERRMVGATLDLGAIFNRHSYSLEAGTHLNIKLQHEWKKFGKEKFLFEILEELQIRTETDYDYKADLECLEDLWLAKLLPYGDLGYNTRKLTRDELLWKIAAARNKRILMQEN